MKIENPVIELRHQEKLGFCPLRASDRARCGRSGYWTNDHRTVGMQWKCYGETVCFEAKVMFARFK